MNDGARPRAPSIGRVRSLVLQSSVAVCLWIGPASAAPGYRLVEPFPRVSLEVPAGWQEHRRDRDVVYAPPGVDYRSTSLSYGVRVFVEPGDTAHVTRRLEALTASYAKTNPGMRTEGPYLVEPGLNRASVAYSIAPADDPTTREAGWIMVARLPTGRWLCLIAVMPEAERARNAGTLSDIRNSLRTPSQ